MNKFLKKYPQLWVPKVGDVVVVIDPNGDCGVDYYKVGAKAIIEHCVPKIDDGSVYYQGNFNPFNPEIQTHTKWTGYYDLGIPFINFVLYTNE